MSGLIENYIVREEKINIEGIPCLRYIPEVKQDKLETIIFYHGLGSDKESQRMRGYILSSFGYQVIVPDAKHHGARDAKFTEDPLQLSRYFWQAILQSIDESEILIDNIIEKYNGDSDNIFVTGHSMGGFTSAGVFTHNEKIRGAAPLNGSFNWKVSNDSLREVHGHRDIKIEEEKIVDILDPILHGDKIRDRDILILHGEKDTEVDIEPQRLFYREMKGQMENLNMIEYEDLGHFVTTNMMEDLIKWIQDLNNNGY